MIAGVPLLSGAAVDLGEVPLLTVEEFRESILIGVRRGGRLASFFGLPGPAGARLVAVIAREDRGILSVLSAAVSDGYPALTPLCPQAHLFEREIFEETGVEPRGHPWLKPVRFPPARLSGRPAVSCGAADFFRIEGEEIHEVAVGPVHAGIIEPGHFRFQCHGEVVHHLEISLGYQHRGIERALVGAPASKTIHYLETLAGDTTVGHAMAYCRIAEALSGCRVSARAQVIRGVALELERIANHLGDLGALSGDVGFLPTMSYCGRIRGDVLNLTAALCGNRFGRGMMRPGGVGFDLEEKTAARLRERLAAALRDAESAIGLLWETPSVLARFEGTGVVTGADAAAAGLVGLAARASGLARDVRRDFPFGIFRMAHIPPASAETGDVFARAFVRWLEIQRSAAFIAEQLQALPEGPARVEGGPWAAGRLAVALVEGWRGEICHAAVTDDAGRFARYQAVDPSFHNWFGLALALRNGQISDFPLCNKSFNLSYCGFDR